jgi:hypothetical protein
MAKRVVDTDRIRVEFFHLAFQYFIAARFAASARLMPVVGTLFHHAIEMFLKGELCMHLSERQRRKISHRLTVLWRAFKDQMADRSLDTFDALIEDLDKFEDIRFPENIVSRGMTCTIGFGTRTPPEFLDARRPRYELFVGEIDALVRAILDKCNVNPSFFTAGYGKDTQTYLRRRNRSEKTRLWSR